MAKVTKRVRPSWEEYALIIAEAASVRSEDPFIQVGACALRYDKSVSGLGYNGAPAGINIDWEDRDARRPFVLHAEENALRYCIPGDVELLAVTLSPCVDCLKAICGYGIKTVVFREWYTTDPSSVRTTKAMAKKFGIKLVHFPKNST